jgi:DNA-binding transcriptional regulator YiaG
MTEAALFHRCRKALGLSQPAIARALLIASDRTIRRWEQNELTVAGPAWVALEGMLRGRGETALADRVTSVIEQRRTGRVAVGVSRT